MNTIKVLIAIDVVTDKPFKEVSDSLKRAIYRGLDTSPNYIAQPKDVDIKYISERN